MTRPDGLALAVLAVLWLAVAAARRRVSWWAPAGFGLGVLVLDVPWLVWRSTYYDQPLLKPPAFELSVMSYAFLLAALVAVGATGLVRHRKPSPSPRPSRRWVPVAVLVLCGLSLPVAAVRQTDVLDWRSRLAQTEEIGTWLSARMPPGSVISTGVAALAYGLGSRMIVLGEDEDGYTGVRRPALATDSNVGYSATQQCVLAPEFEGRYEVATFLRQGSDEWVTVYPRDDEAAALITRLDGDPRLVYVPCPT